jgi:cell wall-associated NlpC family hydrolase
MINLPTDLDPRRLRVLVEAISWLGTRYHSHGRVKGAGVDCLTLLCEVYERAGIIPHVDVPFYRPDAMMHSKKELYLEGVIARGHEVSIPLPGDVVLYKWGRIFAHSGIVIDWPTIIHASAAKGVIETNGLEAELAYDKSGQKRPLRFISPF